MSVDYHKARRYLQRLLTDRDPVELAHCLLPDESQISPRVDGPTRITPRAVQRRWELLGPEAAQAREQLLDERSREQMACYSQNIENYIGTTRMPVGLAGPLRVRGLHARGDYYVPLATTEAALVASCTRGAQVLSQAGGCTAAVVNEGVTRAPAFLFERLVEAGQFLAWVTDQMETFGQIASSSTSHGELTDMRLTLEANHVYLTFEFTTGDAAGQNMVTLATDKICRYIIEHAPVKPRQWFVESNLSGDKKASSASFQSVRGRKVSAEAVIGRDLVQRKLLTSVEAMVEYYHVSSLGGVMSGTIGVQGHYANPLAALFIACGQDAACVAEAAVGVTRFEPTEQGDLYVAATLPNLIVGTVGGGTGLPTQRACLALLGMEGQGQANAFAELCGAMTLAAEVSIIAALAADHFTRAHVRRSRGRNS